MKLFTNKKLVIITATVLLLAVAVGTTLAFVFTKTDPVENTFTPSKVACAVVENGSETENTGNIVYTGDVKTNVMIKNTGDTDAYIRVAVVVTWKNKDGTKVWAQTPVATDYTVNYDLTNGWEKGSDGYYYYKAAVNPNALTNVLITNATQNVTGPVGSDGTQYYLSIEIVASAIQATGISGVTNAQDAWARAAATTSGN